MKPDLGIDICGKRFKNPIIVASAVPKDTEYIKNCVDSGAGGIISKTATFEEVLHRYVSPKFSVLHKKGWPYAFSNYSAEIPVVYSIEEWMKELEDTAKYCAANGSVFISSISGYTLENWAETAKMAENAGADMIECNFSCPLPQDLGYNSSRALGSDPHAAAEVAKVVVESVKIPIFVKLAIEGVDPIDVAKKTAAVGVSGVSVHNKFAALDIDIKTGQPLLHSTYASVGGPWMRPIMLKWIAKVASSLDLPISATNGIWAWEDVVKSIMLGASTVQALNAVLYGAKQFEIIRDLVNGLEQFMETEGYITIAEMRGIALSQIKTKSMSDHSHLGDYY